MLLSTLILLIASCKHQGEPKAGAPDIPTVDLGPVEKLTNDGENLQATFSADGQRILYISRLRPDHRNAQVYEKNLSLQKENRITYQNGEVSFPRYVPRREEIVYASSTDELKESSPFLRDKLKEVVPVSNLPFDLQEPSEIYLHRLDGGGMVRLTNHPGFDGWPLPFPSPGPNKDRIAWAELEKGFLRVRTISQSGKGETTLTQLPANSGQYSPSPKGRMVTWVTFADDFKSSHLWLQQGKDLQELAPELSGLKTDLAWDPTGSILLFSVQKTPQDHFEIYTIHSDGGCLTRISKSQANERYPSLSPDSATMIFSSDLKKGWQIYRRPWTRPCPAPTK